MVHLGQHHPGGVPDIEFGEGHPERLAQRDGVVLGPFTGGKTGHGERENVCARAVFTVHRAGRHDQRVGGVQTAGDADHHLGISQCPQPLLQPETWNAVGLVAILLQPCGIRRHERESRRRAAGRCPLSGGSSTKSTRRTSGSSIPRVRRLSSKVPIRSRSACSSPTSTSATLRRAPWGNARIRPAAHRSRRSSSDRPRPGRWDSPSPAAAYT